MILQNTTSPRVTWNGLGPRQGQWTKTMLQVKRPLPGKYPGNCFSGCNGKPSLPGKRQCKLWLVSKASAHQYFRIERCVNFKCSQWLRRRLDSKRNSEESINGSKMMSTYGDNVDNLDPLIQWTIKLSRTYISFILYLCLKSWLFSKTVLYIDTYVHIRIACHKNAISHTCPVHRVSAQYRENSINPQWALTCIWDSIVICKQANQ